VTGKVKVKGRVYFLKPCPHCHRKWRLSQKSATVAENGEKTATVSRTFLRQSSYLSPKSATVWTGFNAAYMKETRDQKRFTISEVAAD